MSTLKQVLSEHVKMIAEAHATMERERTNPPVSAAPLAAKKMALQALRERAANVAAAKAESVRHFDAQLAVFQKEITALERQLEEDRQRFMP